MKRKFGLGTIFLLLLIAAVIIVAANRDAGEPATGGNGISFLDLPRNEYDRELFAEEDGFIRYEDSLVGIDVSAHQGEIDWEKVKADGVDFAIIRAAYRGYTGGSLSMDPWFKENLKGAKDAGLQVGIYFFSQAVSVEEAEEEAKFLLECLDGEKLDLPVYYDWETVQAEARTDGVTGEEATDFALKFCSIVEKAGYEAGVYFNESMGYMFFRLSDVRQYEFWLAQYQSVPDFYYDFTTWQYSAGGEVDGIGTPVDLNVRFVK